MARSEAQKRADKNYEAKLFLMRVRLPLEVKERIDEHIAITGESMAAFVRRAIITVISDEDPFEYRVSNRLCTDGKE